MSKYFYFAILLLLAVHAVDAEVLPAGIPLASVDLTTNDGARTVDAIWRYSDTRIVETGFRAADKDGQPTGPQVSTYAIEPAAGWRDFDDSGWTTIAASSLSERRGNGRVSFNWYRTRITVPQRIGNVETAGTTVVLTTSLDDYAEVWVDGELPRATAQSGGSVVKGWNADNELVIGRNVKPGQEIQLAIFGINGPISNAPTNFIWMRRARLDFYAGSTAPLAVIPQEVNVQVERLDPAIDQIVPANAKLFKLAEGFQFIEGPVWSPQGYLLFSDPNNNTIYKYTETGELSVYRENSGYQGSDIDMYTQPGSNGLAFDSRGRLTIDEHGNRRVTRLTAGGDVEVLAASYKGKRLNSPNDLVYRSDDSLYFTDPPFGLPKFFDDPRKELPFSGVYRVANGRIDLLDDSLSGPNGLAFSPDEKFLYVGNWDPDHKTVTRYPVRRNGSVGKGELFFDMTGAPGEEALDGLKVDIDGNLYVSGPGGLWILSSDGRHLGTIKGPRLAANFAWGGSDGRTLYMTARSTLYRMNLLVPGSPRAAMPGDEASALRARN